MSSDAINIGFEKKSEAARKIFCYANCDEALFEYHDFYRTDIQILRHLGFDVITSNSLWKLITTRADVYYAWWFGYGALAAVVAFLRRKPFVISGTVHTFDSGGLHDWPFFKRVIMMFSMKVADVSIVCSKGEFDRLGSFTPRSVKLIPLSIDTDLYTFNLEERENIILMITELNKYNIERKMVLPAIIAFSKFSMDNPEYKLVICGSIETEMDTINKFLKSNGIINKVKFTGRVTLKDKISRLQHAKIYLQPTFCEGFGLAIGEALACGTPVITSPEVCVLGTYGDAVSYGNNTTELAECMQNLVSDSLFYNSKKVEGLQKIKEYSLAKRTNEYRKIFTKLRLIPDNAL